MHKGRPGGLHEMPSPANGFEPYPCPLSCIRSFRGWCCDCPLTRMRSRASFVPLAQSYQRFRPYESHDWALANVAILFEPRSGSTSPVLIRRRDL